ncbi:glycosyltransferase family 2 protein [Paraburkholderia sp. D15]|uniref:glycosyltransferase family 2 protein n=1 Tax=Paraburkholderia sp. D15 TaxID=2880218 RepID=UPI00247A8BF8|nr:glycosyltransferase family 2 protein [Paraburkholderia sp. D15]WGS50619.1 glycosyltransferase family 2 protein [Paraburkholderia sp. D15]
MISVCIATYNGAKYIREQLDSIVSQIGAADEIVICDDQSADDTLAIVAAYDDPRIRAYRNESNLGHVRNFEKAMSLSKGDYIFLSDQDDIWIPGRVQTMMSRLNENPSINLVASNFDLINAQGQAIGEFRQLGVAKTARLAQIGSIFLGKAPYFGCTFLMRRNLLRSCLPIPKGIESHDIWFALVASSIGTVLNLQEPTLLHRIHGSNVSVAKRRALLVVLRSRARFLWALALRLISFKLKSA